MLSGFVQNVQKGQIDMSQKDKLRKNGKEGQNVNMKTITLDKSLITKYGVCETLLLTELIDKAQGSIRQFEYSISQLQNEIVLSRKQQTRIIKKLLDLKFIEVQIIGYPPKRYFKINYENLPDCIKARSPTPQQEKTPLSNIQLDKPNPKPNFTSQAKEIIEYFNAKANTKYKTDNKKTLDLIKVRIKEGFTLDDFKTVIDKKVLEWNTDPNMYKYLRPMTLFSTKFESYLNQPTKKPHQKPINKFQNFEPRKYDFEEIERLAMED